MLDVNTEPQKKSKESSDNMLAEELRTVVEGDIDTSEASRDLYSHDASMFELKPQVIVAPKNAHDLEKLVKYVADNKSKHPTLSITARSAGTDMSGAAINDSIIVDFMKHFTSIKEITSSSANVEPGVYYRDFEKETLKHNALMPTYPASRDLCAIGGMVNNNSGG